MNSYTIASFYKFVELLDFESLKPPLLDVMRKHHVLGTIILASEGINGSMSGSPEDLEYVYQHLRSDSRFQDIVFKEMQDNFLPFEKAKVKLRKEIVSLGVKKLDTIHSSGAYVTPEEWNTLISQPEVVVLDTRNEYEVELGTFKHAINPHTENFRDLPQFIESNLEHLKNKTLAIYCTGGIRCEKTSAYLHTLGIKKVYQLKDGILHYLASVPEEHSLWEGKCFVFDDRIAV